jgi:hypothetical protein
MVSLKFDSQWEETAKVTFANAQHCYCSATGDIFTQELMLWTGPAAASIPTKERNNRRKIAAIGGCLRREG